MKALRKEMKLKGLTSQQLAKMIGVSDTAISLWIKGEFLPKPVHVKRLVDLGFSDETALNPGREI